MCEIVQADVSLKVPRQAIALPRWIATDMRWRRNSVSLVSFVTSLMRRPSSEINFLACSPHTPNVSNAQGMNVCVVAIVAYFVIFVASDCSATTPALPADACLDVRGGARVSGTATIRFEFIEI